MRFKDFHSSRRKKKVIEPSNEAKAEITYDYLLSLFVASFNYSKSEFDQLTPVQANLILQHKATIDENDYAFWQAEFRTSNYFTIKSSMGDTKRIRKPSDLYILPQDSKDKRFTSKQIEFFDRRLTEEEKRIIRSL